MDGFQEKAFQSYLSPCLTALENMYFHTALISAQSPRTPPSDICDRLTLI